MICSTLKQAVLHWCVAHYLAVAASVDGLHSFYFFYAYILLLLILLLFYKLYVLCEGACWTVAVMHMRIYLPDAVITLKH
jgi:hypothetical protein